CRLMKSIMWWDERCGMPCKPTTALALPTSMVNDLDWPALAAKLRQVVLVAFDFDGVFTDNTVYVFEDGREAVRCSRAAGIGLARLKALDRQPVILSSEVNPVVSARAAKLGVPCLQGLADKKTVLVELLANRQLTTEQAAFVGNDINDLTCLQL